MERTRCMFIRLFVFSLHLPSSSVRQRRIRKKTHLRFFISLTKISGIFSQQRNTQVCSRLRWWLNIIAFITTFRHFLVEYFHFGTHRAADNERLTLRLQTHRASMSVHEQDQSASISTRSKHKSEVQPSVECVTVQPSTRTSVPLSVHPARCF